MKYLVEKMLSEEQATLSQIPGDIGEKIAPENVIEKIRTLTLKGEDKVAGAAKGVQKKFSAFSHRSAAGIEAAPGAIKNKVYGLFQKKKVGSTK